MSLYHNNPILQEYEKQAMALEEKQKEIDKLKQETEELERRIEILCRMDSQEMETIQELAAIFELLEVKRALISELEEEKSGLEAAYIALDVQLDEEPNILNANAQPENIDGKEEDIYGFSKTEANPTIDTTRSSMTQIEEDDVVTVKFGDHGPIFLKDDIVTVKFEENGTIFLGNNGKSTKYLIEEDWSPSILRDIRSPSPESFSPLRSPSPESVSSARSLKRCEDEKIAAEFPVPRVPEEPPYKTRDYTYTRRETADHSPGSSSYQRDDEAAKCVRKFLKREEDRVSRDSPAAEPSDETGLYPDLTQIDDWTTTEFSHYETFNRHKDGESNDYPKQGWARSRLVSKKLEISRRDVSSSSRLEVKLAVSNSSRKSRRPFRLVSNSSRV